MKRSERMKYARVLKWVSRLSGNQGKNGVTMGVEGTKEWWIGIYIPRGAYTRRPQRINHIALYTDSRPKTFIMLNNVLHDLSERSSNLLIYLWTGDILVFNILRSGYFNQRKPERELEYCRGYLAIPSPLRPLIFRVVISSSSQHPVE